MNFLKSFFSFLFNLIISAATGALLVAVSLLLVKILGITNALIVLIICVGGIYIIVSFSKRWWGDEGPFKAIMVIALGGTLIIICLPVYFVFNYEPGIMSTTPTPRTPEYSSIDIFTPTHSPTNTPVPPTATSTSPVAIAALNIETEVQADGTIKNTAHLSIEDLGYGDLELIAPNRIKFDESGIVRLIITPDSALESFLPVSVEVASVNDPSYSIPINDRIQIYPIMIAELNGVNFEINPSGPQKRVVRSGSQVVWSWSITAKASHEQSLVVTISIPVLIDQTNEEISAELKDIHIQVFVEVTATPTPTYTPQPTATPTPSPTFTPTVTPTPTPTKTTSERVIENLTSNTTNLIGIILTFIVAILTVVLGIPAALTAWKKYRTKTVENISNLTIGEIGVKVKEIADSQILKKWLAEEKKHKNRKGAIEAIERRLKELKENTA